MLFNSFPFLFVFLPAALLSHAAIERWRPQWRLPLLLALSFVFYGCWDLRFVALLAASILVNWLAAEAFWRWRRGVILIAAITADLALLGLFKYLGFFSHLLFGLEAPPISLGLPLGISFFTFHHVMYLADARAGRAPRLSLLRYALYIAFFPQLLAGPLVRWSEMIPQLGRRPGQDSEQPARFGRGLMLITIGLAKKVLLGDALARVIDPIFERATGGDAPTVLEAWHAALGFGFQIYFDFSGYTDIALGLGLLFGIVLPQNFAVPYRASSLQDFWRRWHMTLSRFLRDYLYIPLGGSRSGLPVQLGALTATMTLGGLWHGANMTFVVWGLGHGIGLAAGVMWRRAGLILPGPVGAILTFTTVTLLWVLFRAPDFRTAQVFYSSLAGLAPLGSGKSWSGLLVPAAVALLGPTAWDAAARIEPRPWIAAAFALLLVVVLFKIGDNESYDFIYFRF